MESKKNLLVLIVLVLLIGGVSWFYLGLSKPSAPGVENPPVVIAPSLNPTQAYVEKESARVKVEGGVIPFDYQVKSIEADRATINGLKGDMIITNSPQISYFRKNGDQLTPVKFTDLKIGQKLTLERPVPPEKGLKVYIVGE